jgi:hypothetical protein
MERQTRCGKLAVFQLHCEARSSPTIRHGEKTNKRRTFGREQGQRGHGKLGDLSHMTKVIISLAASCALATPVACGSSSEGGSGDSGGTQRGASDSGGSDGGGSDGGVTLAGQGVCKSAADCADSGAGAICCLGSSFTAVCVPRRCPLTSFGSYQLCASAAECTMIGQTNCGPFMGSYAGLVVCGKPPAEGGTVEDAGVM